MFETARACRIPTRGGYWMPACAGMTAESSLDHLVDDGEHARWNGEAERLRRLHIDHQLEFARLEHRQIRRLRALETLPGITTGLASRLRPAAAVAHQAAGADEFGPFVNCGNPVACGQGHELLTHDLKEHTGAVDDCGGLAC